MRSSSIGIRRTIAIAIALTALTLLAGTAPQAQPHGVVAQASDDEEEIPPRRRGVVPSEEESEPADQREEKPLPAQGASRRLDPFDANEERSGPARAPHPAPAGAVVCEAGCDGPRGAIVYERK
jgi:hypothetical protein